MGSGLAPWLLACSTSPPSGNQVDGLPLVANTGEDSIGPEADW